MCGHDFVHFFPNTAGNLHSASDSDDLERRRLFMSSEIYKILFFIDIRQITI